MRADGNRTPDGLDRDTAAITLSDAESVARTGRSLTETGAGEEERKEDHDHAREQKAMNTAMPGPHTSRARRKLRLFDRPASSRWSLRLPRLLIAVTLALCTVLPLSVANEIVTESAAEVNQTGPKTAEQLGVPRCESNFDCVNKGICVKDKDGYGRCICPSACPSYINKGCNTRTGLYAKHVRDPCGIMDEGYRDKYDLLSPRCHMTRCACPPAFTGLNMSLTGIGNSTAHATLLPVKCHKKELAVVAFAIPGNTVVKGMDLAILCCVNLDPLNVVDMNGLEIVQNSTVVRELSPPKSFEMSDFTNPPWCWTLKIPNVQLTDSGQYTCIARPVDKQRISTESQTNITVNAPRNIQDLEIVAHANNVTMSWKNPDDAADLTVEIKIASRSDSNVWNEIKATSPLVVMDLSPGLPYTAYFVVRDGPQEHFNFSRQFTTLEAQPNPPTIDDVRVHDDEAAEGLVCDVEWRQPVKTNGRITKYYVRVAGHLRTHPPGYSEADIERDLDFPGAQEKACANYDNSEDDIKSINPNDWSSEFYTCKFGKLKPNRNYTVTLWAQNGASKSLAVEGKKQCLTDYAEPNEIAMPASASLSNTSTFGLRFERPAENNGPISCYYVAIIPLRPNISVDAIPKSSEIIIDTQSKAFANNLHPDAETKNRYFAYIAESYSVLPSETVVGDSQLALNHYACKDGYLSRQVKEEDGALTTMLKYTGFLIARVNKIGGREEEPQERVGKNPANTTARGRRALQTGPAYGYSSYFKPVYLQVDGGSSSILTFIVIFLALLAFVAVTGFLGTYLAHRRGFTASWCPLKKMGSVARLANGSSNDRRSLLLSTKHNYDAIPLDSLASEFIMKHRDSDYLFTQEYEVRTLKSLVKEHESLPSYNLPATACDRNSAKNRYKDIKAYDESRVRLAKIPNVPDSDYINANWIRSYRDRKKFIASQAPVEHTMSDFWRMIWEHDVRVVVMLSNLVERSRNQSAKYWPDEGVLKVGNFSLRAGHSEFFADHTIRTIQVEYHPPPGSPVLEPPPGMPETKRPGSGASSRRRSSPDTAGSITSEYANVPVVRSIHSGTEETDFGGVHKARTILHYHFTDWKDCRAPDCAAGLLRFLSKLRALPEFDSSPVVVHCSAGVGRTGTLIAIDSMMDQCAEEGKADVFAFVADMRRQRNLMVQNAEQYVFIHRALAENHLYGMTDVADSSFREFYARSTKPRSMDEEYERLCTTLDPIASRKFADAHPHKNRCSRFVPYDKNRVILAPVLGYADQQYINASSAKGSFNSYFLAADPIKNTIFDFWRMINDHEVATIVTLTDDREWEEGEKYWPCAPSTSREIADDYMTVSIWTLADESHPGYRHREFAYAVTPDKKQRAVQQFCIQGWSSSTTRPPSTNVLLAVIGKVLERQASLREFAPVLVHCRNGSSQTGVFTACCLLMERLKAERRIDIFQTAHSIRGLRPGTFASKDEYAFLYDAVAECISKHR